jgi:hypothetical protein
LASSWSLPLIYQRDVMLEVSMKLSRWQLVISVVLVGSSIALYAIHYIIFGDLHHIALWSFTSFAFLPISVLFVSMIIGGLLAQRDRRAKLEKMNMVIGASFSEVGNEFLRLLADWDRDVGELQDLLHAVDAWKPQEFEVVRRRLSRTARGIDPDTMDLQMTHAFLDGKRDFLLRLLENPNLLEHEAFTALLRAVLHVTEELRYRDDLSALSLSDRKPLVGDLRRAYVLLQQQWVQYMAFIRKAYPYLFSLAARTNPFNPSASVEIQ